MASARPWRPRSPSVCRSRRSSASNAIVTACNGTCTTMARAARASWMRADCRSRLRIFPVNPGRWSIESNRKQPAPGAIMILLAATLTTLCALGDDRPVGAANTVADFVVSATLGVAPLLVQFCDLSTSPNGIVMWAWDFNGDTIVDSTLQHPTFVYFQDGDYTVSLTVGDGLNPSQHVVRVAHIRVTAAATGACAALVLDRSGSMLAVRSGGGGSTRAADAAAFADADLDFLFATPGMQVLLYECHDGVVSRVGGPYAAAAAAKAALLALPAPSGAKPLAEAITLAVTDLVAFSPGTVPADRTLLIYSDDGAHVLGPHTCRQFGPSSSGGDSCAQALFQGPLGPFDPLSWQRAVCDLIAANVGLDAYYFGMFALTVGNDAFFRALCELTGGSFTGVPDDSTMPLHNPWRSLGQGCVDHLGMPLRMLRDGIPQLGATVGIGCRTGSGMPFLLGVGFSDQVAGGRALPFDLGPLGAPGCFVRSSWDVTEGLFAAATNRTLVVPNASALVGMHLFYQGAELHPANNALGVVTSDVLRLEVVP
ncbi:MAG: PKD domain-containing protein [Planctomycetes bacterium]|nr:PKD domain-containing protein [Planctomycetota bacterium]